MTTYKIPEDRQLTRADMFTRFEADPEYGSFLDRCADNGLIESLDGSRWVKDAREDYAAWTAIKVAG